MIPLIFALFLQVRYPAQAPPLTVPAPVAIETIAFRKAMTAGELALVVGRPGAERPIIILGLQVSVTAPAHLTLLAGYGARCETATLVLADRAMGPGPPWGIGAGMLAITADKGLCVSVDRPATVVITGQYDTRIVSMPTPTPARAPGRVAEGPASIVFTAPPNATPTGSIDVSLVVTAGAVPVHHTQVYWEDDPPTHRRMIQSYDGSILNFTWNVLGLPAGPYRVTADAYDAANNVLAHGASGVITVNNSLTKGDKGDPGAAGLPVPIMGSILYLPVGLATPAGYTFLGQTVVSFGGSNRLVVNVFRKL